MGSLADRIKREAENPILLTGDGYTRLMRALQAFFKTNPETQHIPAFTLRPDAGGEFVLLDASKAPFRGNGKAYRCGVNVAAVAAQFTQFSLFNVPPGAQTPSLSLMVIDAVDWQGATVATLGINEADVTALTLQPAPAALEDSPGSSSARATDGQAIFRGAAPASTLSITTIIQGMPSTGATGLYQPALGGDLVLFPGEALVVLAGTVNVAGFLAVHYRRWNLGGIAQVGAT